VPGIVFIGKASRSECERHIFCVGSFVFQVLSEITINCMIQRIQKSVLIRELPGSCYITVIETLAAQNQGALAVEMAC
jgi:hypothetical protein